VKKRRKEKIGTNRVRRRRCKNAEGDDTSIVCTAIMQVQAYSASVYVMYERILLSLPRAARVWNL
jgi:hypothetical protein